MNIAICGDIVCFLSSDTAVYSGIDISIQLHNGGGGGYEFCANRAVNHIIRYKFRAKPSHAPKGAIPSTLCYRSVNRRYPANRH
jgi:hypothetical protein